jgi:4-hydroxybenzoate polyprenyltransferase
MSETRFRSYLQLVRFPLIFTAWSDVLLGYFVIAVGGPGVLSHARVAVMLAATVGLYAGAMALCDCFEYESDKEHGKRRTLPIGIASPHSAFAVAFSLMVLSIGGATLISTAAGLVSVIVALFLVLFASVTRGMPFLGAMSLALTRGLNIVLGISFAHAAGPVVARVEYWGPVAAVCGYVFLVTQMASEEEHPRRERLMILTGAIIVLLVLFNVVLYVSPLAASASIALRVIVSVFVLGVILRLLQLARRVVHELTTESVQKLVVAALVGSIVLNANFLAFTGRAEPTFGVLFLLLPTFFMLRFFHVLYPGTSTAMD